MVYAKRPFAGPDAVLAYLSRYTHRVGITNRRLLALDPAAQTVSFAYKDYADDSRKKVMTLALAEFIRRFRLRLILPERFVKIRHYGLLANRHRHARIAQPVMPCITGHRKIKPTTKTAAAVSAILPVCPNCRQPGLVLVQVTHPVKRYIPGFTDSSVKSSKTAHCHFDRAESLADISAPPGFRRLAQKHAPGEFDSHKSTAKRFTRLRETTVFSRNGTIPTQRRHPSRHTFPYAKMNAAVSAA